MPRLTVGIAGFLPTRTQEADFALRFVRDIHLPFLPVFIVWMTAHPTPPHGVLR